MVGKRNHLTLLPSLVSGPEHSPTFMLALFYIIIYLPRLGFCCSQLRMPFLFRQLSSCDLSHSSYVQAALLSLPKVAIGSMHLPFSLSSGYGHFHSSAVRSEDLRAYLLLFGQSLSFVPRPATTSTTLTR